MVLKCPLPVLERCPSYNYREINYSNITKDGGDQHKVFILKSCTTTQVFHTGNLTF